MVIGVLYDTVVEEPLSIAIRASQGPQHTVFNLTVSDLCPE